MLVTRQDCEEVVDQLAKIMGKPLSIGYGSTSLWYRLAVHEGKTTRWVSPTLPMDEFYDWVSAAIIGAMLMLQGIKEGNDGLES